jgi:hypothetical protein
MCDNERSVATACSGLLDCFALSHDGITVYPVCSIVTIHHVNGLPFPPTISMV